MALPGRVGAEQAADQEVQDLVDSIKAEFLENSGVNAETFVAVSYKTQYINGTNYFVKVGLGGGQFAHLKIYEPLPHTGMKPSLCGFLLEKKKEDCIEYF
ncbi:cystatin-A2-like [Engystomops pustulosus]|uniref:cystatin-A2-like n=1 Tax=Engystomops pustulosus TaxID=76066 RepID=UPI003AFAC226